MDCFFASVSTRDRPDLRGKPVVVSHGSKYGPTGEIAAANYEARRYGLKAGMWMAQARELCTNFVVVPYAFEEYAEVSRQIYEIFVRYTDKVQVSICFSSFSFSLSLSRV